MGDFPADPGADLLGDAEMGVTGLVAAAMITLFAATAAIHVLWGMRIWWPIADEAALARHVVGTKGITRMPPSPAAFAVVLLLALGGVWVAALAGWTPFPGPDWLLRLGGWAMALILLTRGLASWLPFPGVMAEPEFRRLNRRYYGPLIVALGLGTLVLL